MAATVLSDPTTGDLVSRTAIYALDGSGNPVRISSAAPLPVAVTPAPSTIYNRAAASTAAGDSGSLTTTSVSRLAVDVNLTAFTGGTAPTVTFFVDRLGVDGIWYQAWSSGAQAAAAAVSTSVGPGLATNQAITGTVRLRWTFGGTVAPTAVTFSASIVGR